MIFIIITGVFLGLAILNHNRSASTLKELKEKGYVGGVPPCPPISGFLHTWVYNEERKNLICSKCKRTPGEVSES